MYSCVFVDVGRLCTFAGMKHWLRGTFVCVCRHETLAARTAVEEQRQQNIVMLVNMRCLCAFAGMRGCYMYSCVFVNMCVCRHELLLHVFMHVCKLVCLQA